MSVPTRATRATSALRRAILVAIAASLSVWALIACEACGPSEPRALILADATGADHAAWVGSRATEFEKHGARRVRVLRIESGEAAIALASRGEADAAILPESTPVDRFLAADHGRDAGIISRAGARFRVVIVNPKQHPKVDVQGESLAEFLRSADRE